MIGLGKLITKWGFVLFLSAENTTRDIPVPKKTFIFSLSCHFNVSNNVLGKLNLFPYKAKDHVEDDERDVDHDLERFKI